MADDTAVFTQVQVFRGEEQQAVDSESSGVDDIGLTRKLRLYASKPAVERYGFHYPGPMHKGLTDK
jgi:hypothetical protein